MFKKILPLIIIVTPLLFITGCAIDQGFLQVPNASEENNRLVDNQNLSEKLQDAVEHSYPKEEIKIYADHFNVLIVGQYSSKESQLSVEKLIQSEPAVKKVVDYATIQTKPSLNIDSSIQKDAATRLQDEPNITLYHIQVIAVDHVVYLFGQAGFAEEENVQNVVNGISAMDGVIKVVDLITLTDE